MGAAVGATVLIVCAILLAILACTGVKPGRLICTGVGLLLFSGFTLSSFGFVIGLSMFASAFVVGLMGKENNQRAGLAITLGFAFIAFLLVAIPRFQETRARMAALEKYSFVSLRDRVTPINDQKFEVNVPDATKVAWEQETPNHDHFTWRSRSRAIAWLHRSAVGHFLETPDFGVLRMGFPSLHDLENDDGTPIQLPSNDDAYPTSQDGDAFAGNHYDQVEMDKLLADGHKEYQSWFLDNDRFGSIEDLDHVAGFLPHAFVKDWRRDSSQAPLDQVTRTSTLKIRLNKLQLVGLLYHPEPVVYELDTMPALLNAKSAPTRPLDNFEQRGLEKLLQGEFVHFEQVGEHLRVMGSLRNAKSCVQCHEGPTTQLLGAFSYVLSPEESQMPQHQGEPLTMQ